LQDKIKFESMIFNAERPLIIFGAGIKWSNTEKEAKKFADKYKIPYVVTWAVKDLFPEALTFGISATRGGNFAVQNADLLIILGSRLDSHQTGSLRSFNECKKIRVDIDDAELKYHNIDLKIHCDLKDFFGEIL